MSIVSVEVNNDGFKKMIEGLDFIKKSEVYVGITEKETSREDESITNAELLFIHTNGSPVNNIPARPVIEPAIKDDSERISKILALSDLNALNGKFEEAEKQLKIAGMRGQNVSRAWFTNSKNNWPPNSPSVIRSKIKKGSDNPRPLIDTGEFRKSITYFVSVKGEIK